MTFMCTRFKAIPKTMHSMKWGWTSLDYIQSSYIKINDEYKQIWETKFWVLTDCLTWQPSIYSSFRIWIYTVCPSFPISIYTPFHTHYAHPQWSDIRCLQCTLCLSTTIWIYTLLHTQYGHPFQSEHTLASTLCPSKTIWIYTLLQTNYAHPHWSIQ